SATMPADTKEKIRLGYEMAGNELVFRWEYNSGAYTAATIRQLSESFIRNLDFIIDHCCDLHGKGISENTPSDFGLSNEVSYQELENFLREPLDEGKTRQQLISDCYRLSGLQAGMLFHSLYDENALTYRNQLKADLTDVNLAAFRESWGYILERHSILRSSIHPDVFKVPVQCVYKKVDIPLQIIDFRHLAGDEQQAAVRGYEEQDRKTGFDFTKAPLMRVILLQLADNRYRMLWTSHHILHDGWSLPILMEEFLTIYDAKVTGAVLEPLPEDRYEDYIRYVEKRDIEKDEEYWRTYLQEVQEGTLMPFISSSVKRTKGIGRYKEEVLNLDEAATQRISDFAKSRRITVNTLMQTVWAFLLHKYTGKQNIVFGTVVSGRPEDLQGIEHRVGMYINTLPLHSSLRKEEKIDDWLQRTLKDQVASREHQHTPLTEIQRLSGVQGDLFDSIMVFQNFPISAIVSGKDWQLKVEDLDVQEQANYPFYITVGAFEEINVHFFHNTLLLDAYYVEQIKRHFGEVLSKIIQNGQLSVSELQLLNEEEKHKILYGWNNTTVAYEKGSSTVTALFEAQAALTPDKPAITRAGYQLDFHTLNEKANRLAHYLREKGVSKEWLVPVCMYPSSEMLVGILGVLKAGAAYVPVDPAYPADRIAYILKETRAAVVLTAAQDSEPQALADSGVTLVRVREVIDSGNAANPVPVAGLQDLAYVIYTSGSTGTPKGVMVEHGSLTNYLLNSKKRYAGTGNAAGSYLHLSYTFDAAITAMFVPLISGMPVVLPSTTGVSVFEDALLSNNAPYDFIKLTPAHLPLLAGRQQVAGYPFTRRIISGGEALTGEQLGFLAGQEEVVEIVNEYGPTEATVGCSVYSLVLGGGVAPVAGAVPIGKPLDNVKLYILDAAGEPVPVGATGELYIGGVQLARGYLHQPELTAMRFLQNPFDSGRIYRTGDLARWLPDGNIEYLGRADEQVKIRGYRIEPAEIEATIRELPGVQDVRILIAGNESDTHKRICAFILGDKPGLTEEVQLHLQRKLPEYMQPNQFFQPASFPLNSHGKVDRKALLQLTAEHVAVGPRNELEAVLVRIWKDLLEVEQVGVRDTFFSLGGDSLLAIRLISVIRQELKLEVTISKLFDLTTIEELARYLGQQQEDLVKEEDYETIRL
ncbi:MAG TPA: amino acid adenylation domain-containing protein, partial [Chitinophaga sp.]|nr:amino acid adenylation domain-containing protein [Chitinophaga sp.]